jgi:hypothetical protein
MKVHWDDSGDRILLGDNTGCGVVTLRLIRFQCVWLYIYIYIYLYIFNCNWVDTRWQQYSSHLHTNSTHNTQNETYISQNWTCITKKKKLIWEVYFNCTSLYVHSQFTICTLNTDLRRAYRKYRARQGVSLNIYRTEQSLLLGSQLSLAHVC